MTEHFWLVRKKHTEKENKQNFEDDQKYIEREKKTYQNVECDWSTDRKWIKATAINEETAKKRKKIVLCFLLSL